jgi:hypothetical protein
MLVRRGLVAIGPPDQHEVAGMPCGGRRSASLLTAALPKCLSHGRLSTIALATVDDDVEPALGGKELQELVVGGVESSTNEQVSHHVVPMDPHQAGWPIRWPRLANGWTMLRPGRETARQITSTCGPSAAGPETVAILVPGIIARPICLREGKEERGSSPRQRTAARTAASARSTDTATITPTLSQRRRRTAASLSSATLAQSAR